MNGLRLSWLPIRFRSCPHCDSLRIVEWTDTPLSWWSPALVRECRDCGAVWMTADEDGET